MESTFNWRLIVVRTDLISRAISLGQALCSLSTSQSHIVNRYYYYPYFKDEEMVPRCFLSNMSEITQSVRGRAGF